VRWLRRKKPEVPLDGLREFIYLDETSVVSLLAAIQGAIPDTVKDTTTRGRERGVRIKSGLSGVAEAEASVGASSTTGTETLRRAVAQSTFRELWRRDADVRLHDTASFKANLGGPIRDSSELASRIDTLVAVRAAAEVGDLTRGTVVEVGWNVRPDEAHQTMIAARTMFDLMKGREALFQVAAENLAQYGPMFEVLGEFSVGLVPIRGRCTTHRLHDIDGTAYLVAEAAVDPTGPARTASRELEIVSFTEEASYWRDPRTTLMAGIDCTAYLRINNTGLLETPWNPFKLADVLGALGPGMRTDAIKALEFLRRPDVGSVQPAVAMNEVALVRTFAELAQQQFGAADVSTELIERTAAELAAAERLPDERRALDPIVNSVTSGAKVDRELVRTLRDQAASHELAVHATSPITTASSVPSAQEPQLEVGVIALYW